MKRSHLIATLVVFVLSLLVPTVVQKDYVLQVLFRIYLFAALGLAWNLVGGYAGQLSLGHAAYFGAGAYGLALFSSKLGISPWIALLMSVVVVLFLPEGIVGTTSTFLRRRTMYGGIKAGAGRAG